MKKDKIIAWFQGVKPGAEKWLSKHGFSQENVKEVLRAVREHTVFLVVWGTLFILCLFVWNDQFSDFFEIIGVFISSITLFFSFQAWLAYRAWNRESQRMPELAQDQVDETDVVVIVNLRSQSDLTMIKQVSRTLRKKNITAADNQEFCALFKEIVGRDDMCEIKSPGVSGQTMKLECLSFTNQDFAAMHVNALLISGDNMPDKHDARKNYLNNYSRAIAQCEKVIANSGTIHLFYNGIIPLSSVIGHKFRNSHSIRQYHWDNGQYYALLEMDKAGNSLIPPEDKDRH